MRNYETTFIVDPVLSGEEIKATAQAYVEHLRKENCEIVYVDEMGLRTLAYSINKKNSGVYYSIEYKAENGVFLRAFELALQRDVRILRFLTVALDKFGVQYNQDKRDGKIAKAKKPKPSKTSDVSATAMSRKKADGPHLSGVPSGDAESFKEEE